MSMQVTIFPREGVRDPQGEAVFEKLKRNGEFGKALKGVRVGKILLLDVDTANLAEAEAVTHRMCKELLVNEVIEDYTIEIPEED